MGKAIRVIVIITFICGALWPSFGCRYSDEADCAAEESATRGDEGEAGDVCPECGSENVIPIVYGKPGEELIEKAERGEVKLGGCVVTDDSPYRYCAECGNEW
jgi:hypothetical protein